MIKKLLKITGVLLIILLIVISVIGMVIGAAFYMLTHAPCSFDQTHAKQKVEKYLSENNLPLEFLAYEPDKSKGCNFSYLYNGAGEKIHFVVIDDFVRGSKLTYWDYNKRGE